MALALESAGRPVGYSISEYGRTRPWTWAGESGHMWRTSPDMERNWASVMSIADTQAGMAHFTGPHHWNDADMIRAPCPNRCAGS